MGNYFNVLIGSMLYYYLNMINKLKNGMCPDNEENSKMAKENLLNCNDDKFERTKIGNNFNKNFNKQTTPKANINRNNSNNKNEYQLLKNNEELDSIIKIEKDKEDFIKLKNEINLGEEDLFEYDEDLREDKNINDAEDLKTSLIDENNLEDGRVNANIINNSKNDNNEEIVNTNTINYNTEIDELKAQIFYNENYI